ncbi:hypothetical protein NM208_g10196 [Fusarium decemcellulare]|uniref:Uncharacterized protein n=1 Tax=Fusarium decemcellulare TaxID=57161 RepID=A0ACC1RYT9_9HYPO|nr:hypothetical protein NM208_g10196 [Fusarium decemcellulare]
MTDEPNAQAAQCKRRPFIINGYLHNLLSSDIQSGLEVSTDLVPGSPHENHAPDLVAQDGFDTSLNVGLYIPKAPKGLHNLPRELLIEIATQLCPLDRASLACVSRHTHMIAGRALRVDWKLRFKLLERLESDGVWLSEILCSLCYRFHQPRDLVWTEAEGHRECVLYGDPTIARKTTSPYLPTQVYFDIVSAISRCSRFGSKLYDVDRLASSHHYKRDGAKINRIVSARVHQEHVIIKTETVLFSGQNRATALENVHNIERLIHDNAGLAPICGHGLWIDLLRFAFPNIVDSLVSPHFPPLYRSEVQECLWTHERTCWTRCDVSSRLENWLRTMFSCAHCATNFNASVVYLQDTQTKLLILTSWKDLGRCQDVTDIFWEGHLEHRPNRHEQSFWPTVGRSIWHRFEGIAEDEGDCVYSPRVSRRHIDGFLD